MTSGNYIDRAAASVFTVALHHLDHKLDKSVYNFDIIKAR